MRKSFLQKSQIFNELLLNLQPGEALPKEEVRRKLGNVSNRTVETFKNEFQDILGIEVVTKRSLGGYRYHENVTRSSDKLDKFEAYEFKKALEELAKFKQPESFKKLFPVFSVVLNQLFDHGILLNAIENKLQFDNQYTFKGIEHLPLLTEYAIKKTVICFDFYDFNTRRTSSKVIIPFLLREYDKRWYLVGFEKNSHEPKHFGLDRISKIIKAKVKFKLPKKFDYAEFTKYNFGITHHSISPPNDKIILSFEAIQEGYIGKRPVHHSQEVIYLKGQNFKNRFNISLNVHWENSPELKQFVRKYGNEVIVVSPKEFKKEVKKFS